MNKNFLIISIITFFIISCVYAIDTDNMKVLFSFEDNNATILYDSISGYNLTSGTPTNWFIYPTGINGKSLNSSNLVATESMTGRVYDFSSSSYSINFWSYSNYISTLGLGLHNTSRNDLNDGDIAFFPNINHASTGLNFCSKSGTNPFASCPIAYNTSNFNPEVNIWHMYTLTINKYTNTAKIYYDGVNVASNLSLVTGSNGFEGGAKNYLIIQVRGFLRIDELSLWNTELLQDDINILYANNGSYSTLESIITPSTPYIAMSSANTNVLDNLLTVYPNVAGQTQITGFYYIDTFQDPTYKGVICDVNTSLNIYEDFTGVTIASEDGWSGNYTTGIFNNNMFGLSLAFNGSVISDTQKLINPFTKNIEVSYILKPQGYSSPAFADYSTDTFISLRSSLGADVIPIDYQYNNSQNKTCIYSYRTDGSKLLIHCINDFSVEDWINVSIFIDFSRSKTYTLKIVGSNGDVAYSNPTPFYYNASDIGKIFINPAYNENYTADPNQYFDNFRVTNLNNDYPILVNSNVTNITYPSHISCFFNSCSIVGSETVYNGNQSYIQDCDYSKLKCYTTRFYTYNQDKNVYSNFQEWYLCSLSKPVDNAVNLPKYAINGEPEEQQFIHTLPIEWRYWIMIIISFIVLIVPMIYAGREGVLAGLAFSTVLCISLTIVFELSVIIPIIYTIIGAGIFAILLRNTMTG